MNVNIFYLLFQNGLFRCVVIAVCKYNIPMGVTRRMKISKIKKIALLLSSDV